jgi:hypothetical protein
MSAIVDVVVHRRRPLRLVGEDAAKLIQLGIEYEPQPPFGPLDREPATVDFLRPMVRGPLPDVLTEHPYLSRTTRLGGTSPRGEVDPSLSAAVGE